MMQKTKNDAAPRSPAAVTVIADAARCVLSLLGLEARHVLARHSGGDWGCVTLATALRNARQVLSASGAVVSCFRVELDVWVTTENGVTTIIALPPPPDGQAPAL